MAMQAGLLAGLANLGSVAPDYAGMGLNYLGTGVLTGNWGGTSKERKNQIHDIRTLRRREYQDMVHSLRKAGLNPVLAVGASPGHASAQQVAALSGVDFAQGGGSAGVGSAIAANRTAGVAEKRSPSQIGKDTALGGLASQQATATQLGIPNILQQWEINQATIDKVRQDTKTGVALENLYGQDAINKGASAAKLRKDIDMLDKYGPPGASFEGMLREFLTPSSPKSSAKGWWETLGEKHQKAVEDRESGKDTTWRPPSLLDLWRD